MAGTLPGVECARRRRFHQSAAWSDAPVAAGHGLTRRSSFCLYTSNHESNLGSAHSLPRRTVHPAYQDEKLGGVAREAKERLDERLRAQGKSEPKRKNSQEKMAFTEGRTERSKDLQTEVFGLKKFSWVRMIWKSMGQEDCAICLDRFKARERLVNLPCSHRFHSRCLDPWLQNNAHCPCCRMGISN